MRTLLLFVGLAVLHTWPLATAPGSLSRHDSADALLNEWIVSWVAHALATDPFRLFDANIFHPEPRTLAFSEHLMTPSLVAAPLLWAGLPTLLAHNLSLLAGFTLTGWTMAVVVGRWTGDRWAGVVAGALLAFNANSLTRLAHLQASHLEFLPLALAAIDRLLRQGRPRDMVALACWAGLQALASGYLLVTTAVTLLLSAAARATEWTRRDARRTALLLAGSAGLAAALLLPFLWPYYLVRLEQGLVRPLDEVALYSATWSSYLSTGATLHYRLWAHRFYGPDSFFPGIAALALMAVAVASGIAWRDRRARMLLVAGAAGVLLSFGPRLPGYAALHESLPLLQGIRGAARFGLLGLVAAAGLAGFGLARLRAGAGAGSARQALGAAALLIVTIEACRAPVAWTDRLRVSAVYELLTAEPPGALLELPFPSPPRTAANAPAVLASTRHFRPLVNGYSGFVPASYARHADALSGFPDEQSRQLLDQLGVAHVIVHEDRDPALGTAAAGADWLRRVASDAHVVLYRVQR